MNPINSPEDYIRFTKWFNKNILDLSDINQKFKIEHHLLSIAELVLALLKLDSIKNFLAKKYYFV